MNTRLIHLPKIADERGNLSFIEAGKPIPFFIERAYWIYDVPGGECRGGHAFKENQEFIIAISGSFNIVVENEAQMDIFTLNRPDQGLYVPKQTWRRLDNFSTNAVALILASHVYNQEDYIRDYKLFRSLPLEKP